ncbi:hypothetical protein WJX82_005461 [Trebouxia sp. C0006]
MQRRIQRQLPRAAFRIHCLSQLQGHNLEMKANLLNLLTTAVLKEHNVLAKVFDCCMKDENGIIIEDTLSEEDLDKVLLHCSWLLRKLCQPSAYSSIRDKVRVTSFTVDSSEDNVWLADFSTSLARWQKQCRAGQPGAKLKEECVQKTDPVLEVLYSMYNPDEIAKQVQYHTKGAAAIEAAYNDLESVLKELQALHKQADAAHEQTTSNITSQASSNSFRRQQEHNAAVEKIQAVLPFLEAELLDAAHDDPSRLIVPVVMLPLIQERLSDEAAQHAERTAQKAFDDLLQDEASVSAKDAAKAAAKQAKKLRQKAKRAPIIAQQATHVVESAQLMSNIASEALFLHTQRPAAVKTPAEYKLLCCPITKVLLVEPVIAADGHTYEKSAME